MLSADQHLAYQSDSKCTLFPRHKHAGSAPVRQPSEVSPVFHDFAIRTSARPPRDNVLLGAFPLG